MINNCLNVSEAAARKMEALILDGILLPGKKMPSERQLSVTLGVSRPLIREALRELRGKGVIRTEHGRGSFVVKMVPAVDQDGPLLHLFRDHPRTLYDFLEVRELLEGQAAYLAAQRSTEEDQYRIRTAFEAMEQFDSRVSDDESFRVSNVEAHSDHAFHCSIANASHNPVLIHTLQGLSELTLHSVLASVTNLYHRPKHKKKIDEHHRRIYTAIMRRDGEEAQVAAAGHVREMYEQMKGVEQQEACFIRAEIVPIKAVL